MLTLKSLDEYSQKYVRCHTRKKRKKWQVSLLKNIYICTMFVTISLQELNLSMCINILYYFTILVPTAFRLYLVIC